jgi:hypothetical protein
MEERRTHCPRCAEPATRIVRGTPDPEYLQDLERAGIDYELGGLVAFEESSEWWCRSCGLLIGRSFFLPLFTQVRGIEILRTSPFGDSRKFTSP